MEIYAAIHLPMTALLLMYPHDSHIAVKKYWIISRVVEVITSQGNEIYHEWPKATSDKFITLTSD